jgi:hypothetical protein
VNREVVYHASLLGIVCTPRLQFQGKVFTIHDSGRERPSYFPRLDQLADRPVSRGASHMMIRGQHHSRPVASTRHAECILKVEAKRFFTKHMYASRRGRQCYFGMPVVAGRDIDRVDERKKLVDAAYRMRDVEVSGKSAGVLSVSARDSDQPATRDRADGVRHPRARDVAGPDETPTDSGRRLLGCGVNHATLSQ